MSARKIIVSVATSADGYIARSDGGVEWLDRPWPKGGYGMGAFLESIDALVMGRKTYDFAVRSGGGGGGGSKSAMKTYVFSRTPPPGPVRGAEFVSEPVPSFARRLRAEPGKNVWLMGGAEIIASFLDAGEIDELVLHVVPTLIGEGIPLVAPRHRNVPLALLATRGFEDGVVLLHYAVQRIEAAPKRRRAARRPAKPR